jgi:hypothetical protein
MKKTKAELETIDNWLCANGVSNYTIGDEGVVDVHGRLDFGQPKFCSSPLDTMVCQIGTVTGVFSCSGTDVSCIDRFPRIVTNSVFCDQTKIRSLSGIEKHVQHIGQGFYCDTGVTNVLGLLLIDGLKYVNIDQNGPVDKVINKYLGTGDILSAQDELIDAGCIEQASL